MFFHTLTFTSYTTANGLANNFVLCIEEDQKGNMWFGTNEGGVSCFDGKSFTNYNIKNGLPNNQILCVLNDSKGNIWLGTGGGGLCRFDGKSFTTLTSADGLANNFVLSALEDKNGNLWFGTDGSGVSRYDGRTFTNFSKNDGLTGKIIRCIKEDSKGNLWLGTDGNGVFHYDGKAFVNFTTEQGLANNAVFSIVEDEAGNMWFSTYGGGVSCYKGKAITHFYTTQGLANNQVTSITEDKNGNLWFGSYGGGITRYNGRSFTSFNESQGLTSNIIISVAADSAGKLWAGAFQGHLSSFDGKTFTKYTTGNGLPSNTVNCTKTDSKGNIWFGTNRGLSCYNGHSFTNYTEKQGLAANTIICITADHKGNIWVGTTGGLSCYNASQERKTEETFFTNYTTTDGLSSNVIYNIAEDKNGNLWIANAEGLTRYDGHSFLNFCLREGLPEGAVTQVIQDRNGNIWFGHKDGICRIFFQNKKNKLTPAGIVNLSNEELKNRVPVLDLFGTRTGYPIKDINSGPGILFEDSNGIIWIATGSDKTGLVRLDPSALNTSQSLSTLSITSISVNGEKISWYNLIKNKTKDDSLASINEEMLVWGKKRDFTELDSIYKNYKDILFDSVSPWYPLPQKLVLPYNCNNITIDFSTAELTSSFMVRYQYMLEGFDKSWSPLTDKSFATLGNIPEGTYTFKVKAQSPFGVWSQPISYTFKVLPPWWRTWWMYLLYFAIIVSVIVIIVRWNNRRLISQKNKLKTKIVRATNTIREEKEKIQKANELINKQRHAAEEQKKNVEEKNKDILDSIHYAKRIQDALLIKEAYFQEYLPECFVLFMPKDIVSGDFYWAHSKSAQMPNGKEHTFWYVAAVDCTGHGVPGAFMSMLGMSFLNEILSSTTTILSPAEVLDQLRNKVIADLGQTGRIENSKDGMDISLVRWEFETNEFQWAGANNPIYIIRNGEMEKIKADKQPIGYFPELKPFTNHFFQLQKGDCFYIFSDGYADQFGGPNGKKLKNKQLEETIIKNCSLPMHQQRSILKKAFYAWKGELDQVDDVCIVGARVG